MANLEVQSLAFSRRDWWKQRNTSWQSVHRRDWNRHLSHKSTRWMAFTGADSLQRPSFFRLRHFKETRNTLRATFGRGCRPTVQHAMRDVEESYPGDTAGFIATPYSCIRTWWVPLPPGGTAFRFRVNPTRLCILAPRRRSFLSRSIQLLASLQTHV
jgi:hypothetical protein